MTHHRPPALLVLALFTAPMLAACIGPDGAAPASDGVTVQVVGPDGAAIPNPWMAALADRVVLTVVQGDAQGRLALGALPEATERVRVGADGHAPRDFAADAVPDRIVLAPATTEFLARPPVPGGLVDPLLAFLDAVPLLCGTDAVTGIKDTAFRRNCGGFGEPVVEVAGDGTIWASATCCVGRAPPIWVSRDGGESFQLLDQGPTGILQEATGIEGDFAIDDAGNVYFFDILLATAYFTSWRADGTHRWTVPIALPPLVDRPWVRGGVADEVFILYNTGTSTEFFRSTDGGRTWDPTSRSTFPCALGTIGQGPTRDRMFVAACGSAPRLWLTEDAGQTWSEPEPVPLPEGDVDQRRIFFIMPPVSDDDGTVYVPFTHTIPGTDKEKAVYLAVRTADGAWKGPWQVSGGGSNEMPWPAAGASGHVGIAWYATDRPVDDLEGAVWHLMAAVTTDGTAEPPTFQVVRADPDPVLVGPFGRNLGDFLQADLTPDGRLGIVYARNVAGQPYVNLFVQSDGALDMAPAVFLNGPRG